MTTKYIEMRKPSAFIMEERLKECVSNNEPHIIIWTYPNLTQAHMICSVGHLCAQLGPLSRKEFISCFSLNAAELTAPVREANSGARRHCFAYFNAGIDSISIDCIPSHALAREFADFLYEVIINKFRELTSECSEQD